MDPPEEDTLSTAWRHCRDHVCYVVDLHWAQPFTGIDLMPEMFFCYFSNEYCPVNWLTVRSRSCHHYFRYFQLYALLQDQNGFALCLHTKEDGSSGVCGALIDPEETKFSAVAWNQVQLMRAKMTRRCAHCQHEQSVNVADGWQWRCEKCAKSCCIMHGKHHDEHGSCLDYAIDLQTKNVRDELDEQLKKTEPSRLTPCPKCRSLIVPADRNGHVYLHCLFCDTSFCSSCKEQVEGADAMNAHYNHWSMSGCAGLLVPNTPKTWSTRLVESLTLIITIQVDIYYVCGCMAAWALFFLMWQVVLPLLTISYPCIPSGWRLVTKVIGALISVSLILLWGDELFPTMLAISFPLPLASFLFQGYRDWKIKKQQFAIEEDREPEVGDSCPV